MAQAGLVGWRKQCERGHGSESSSNKATYKQNRTQAWTECSECWQLPKGAGFFFFFLKWNLFDRTIPLRNKIP